MKILMLNHEFPPVGGGASPVTFELCRQLVKMGHDVDVVTMHYDKLPRFEQIEGFGVYRTPALRKRPNICYTHELATYVPGALRRTLRLAREKRYDVIHCHFMVPGAPLAYIVSKRADIPFLVTCHGSDVPGYNPDRFGVVHKMITPAWRFFARRTPFMTAPSESLKELILRHHPGAYVTVVPNGIYPETFSPTEKKNSILMCSRIFKRKGFQYVIEAIKSIQKKLDWEVNLVGEGPYLPELRKIAQGSPTDVKFWGWLDKSDPRFVELFNTSSIFIFTSEAESFGMVIAEAMAAGNAIIASNIPAHQEVLGDAGLFVEPASAAGIRTALIKLIDNPALRTDLQKLARDRVCKYFAWDVITRRYVDCYQQAIDGYKNR
jgi:glycosyltransferase involved in cell wall biosynthesis